MSNIIYRSYMKYITFLSIKIIIRKSILYSS
nr:MAG TPA: hypothetical protein [Crassvirales sp.]